ncbi:hypothetical protein, partial [Nocardia cyriacigeorgica]|uniref:hypothetical protein n=1 Tax=Nocardia cyriacigeorgica TaxID=135487 RepID=UPI001C499C83
MIARSAEWLAYPHSAISGIPACSRQMGSKDRRPGTYAKRPRYPGQAGKVDADAREGDPATHRADAPLRAAA